MGKNYHFWLMIDGRFRVKSLVTVKTKPLQMS